MSKGSTVNQGWNSNSSFCSLQSVTNTHTVTYLVRRVVVCVVCPTQVGVLRIYNAVSLCRWCSTTGRSVSSKSVYPFAAPVASATFTNKIIEESAGRQTGNSIAHSAARNSSAVAESIGTTLPSEHYFKRSVACTGCPSNSGAAACVTQILQIRWRRARWSKRGKSSMSADSRAGASATKLLQTEEVVGAWQKPGQQ